MHMFVLGLSVRLPVNYRNRRTVAEDTELAKRAIFETC